MPRCAVGVQVSDLSHNVADGADKNDDMETRAVACMHHVLFPCGLLVVNDVADVLVDPVDEGRLKLRPVFCNGLAARFK